MKLRTMALIAGISVLAVSAFGQKGAQIYSSANMRHIGMKRAGLSSADRSFMTSFAIGHLAEAKLGELAAKQGGAWGKAYGKTMMSDHNMALQELRDIAKHRHYSLPTKIDAAHQAVYNRLAKLHGEAFDSAYRAEMIKGHRAVLSAVQAEMKNGNDSLVQNYAVKLEPTVKMHLKMAQTKTTM